jgi:hypothetical protein
MANGGDVTEQKPGRRLRCLSPATDEVCQARDTWLTWDEEPAAEIIPESDAQLGASLRQTKEGVAAVATDVAAGATADFAFGYLTADVVLRAVRVQGNVRMVEHGQQLGLIGVQPLQQAIKSDEAGVTAEHVVEPFVELGTPPRCRCDAVVFQIGVELPDQRTHKLLGGTLVVGERVKLVYQPLRMDPAQRMVADSELAGVVADNYSLLQKTVHLDAAPQRAFGRDLHRIGCRRQLRDPKLVKMRLPGSGIGKPLVRVCRGAGDDGLGKCSLAHIAQRGIVDHVISVSGA